MPPTKLRPPPRPPGRPWTQAELRLAGHALGESLATQRSALIDAAMAVIEKYTLKIQDAKNADAIMGLLTVFAAENLGVFCDTMARGFEAWSDAGLLGCPSCEGAMPNTLVAMEHDTTTGGLVCPECGYREAR